MREDLIHDALNSLDDDLIGEVEYLRNRKKSKTKQWISWAAMAACACIVVGSLFAGIERLEIGQSTEGASMQDANEMTEDTENSSDAQYPANSEALVGKDKIDNESMREVPAFLVEIKEWQVDGFVGTIVGIVDTDIYPVGTEVYVDMTSISKLADMNELYSEGSVLHVQFNRLDEGEQIILHAEEIWEAESE